MGTAAQLHQGQGRDRVRTSPSPSPSPNPNPSPNPSPNYTQCDPSTGYLPASQVESTLARFVAVEEAAAGEDEAAGAQHVVEATSPSSSPPQPQPQPQPQQPTPVLVEPQCCWSAWGGEAACGGYPASSSRGACNTDWARACFANGDCPPPPALPTLATAGPDLRPSLATAAFRQTLRELAEIPGS